MVKVLCSPMRYHSLGETLPTGLWFTEVCGHSSENILLAEKHRSVTAPGVVRGAFFFAFVFLAPETLR